MAKEITAYIISAITVLAFVMFVGVAAIVWLEFFANDKDVGLTSLILKYIVIATLIAAGLAFLLFLPYLRKVRT